nr:YaaL family protein [uncultured Bacillus sp.]
MLFQRKGKLRKEFDERLINQIQLSKKGWDHQNHLVDNSFDPFGQVSLQAKISGAKYVFLLKEARKRRLSAIK